MDKLLVKPTDDIRQYSPLTLAFIGDGVFDLLVREYFVSDANAPAGELNKRKVQLVCCKTQAEMSRILAEYLTDDEMEIFKRGRNAHVHAPKNQKLSDYHAATGLECLFGYLYLCGKIERIRCLFDVIIKKYHQNI